MDVLLKSKCAVYTLRNVLLVKDKVRNSVEVLLNKQLL